MSLQDQLAKLTQDDEATPVDVLMQLLDENKTIMTANIKKPAVMNALKIYIAHYGNPDPNNKSYSPKCALVMQTLYDSILLHSISHNGWRAEQIVKSLNGLMVFLGMGNGNPSQEQQSSGSRLFGRKR